jgi:Protein of unknown function (DUF3300)
MRKDSSDPYQKIGHSFVTFIVPAPSKHMDGERRRKMTRSTLKSMFRTVAASLVLLVPAGTTVALAQEAQVPADQAAPRTALTAQQLDNLVAPLALYPDPLLSQVLVASTYPLEVVEANQWLQQNRSLTGTALMDAAKQQNWDPSVQALVAFPDVLARLNQDVRWTTDLGNAFLGQQKDVMAAVQRLRARAQANGKLKTTPQQTVTTETQDGQSAIGIQPADPQTIYVPTYDPAYVWGPPAYGYYPPLYYPTYGFGFGFGIPMGGFYFGWPGWGGWGWGCNWFGGGIFVSGAFFGHYGYHYGGAYGYHGGFAGHQAWAHDSSRVSRATGTAGYSRSYNTAANSRAGAAAGARAGAAAGARTGAAAGARAGAAGQSFNRGGAAGQSVNRGAAGQSFNRGGTTAQSFNRGATGQSFNRGAAGQPAARSYSAPGRSYAPQAAGRSYSAPSRSYSAPSHSYSGGGSAARSSGGGGGFHGGGGGGSHGGGRR